MVLIIVGWCLVVLGFLAMHVSRWIVQREGWQGRRKLRDFPLLRIARAAALCGVLVLAAGLGSHLWQAMP